MFSPTSPLTGSVTIVSKLALAAPVEFVLSAETAVTNVVCETVGGKDVITSVL